MTKNNYSNAKPIYENIKVNSLYDKGNEITYWSARGSGTGIDWYEVTKNQFKKWGEISFLILGEKPIYDLLIDDKALNILDIDRIL